MFIMTTTTTTSAIHRLEMVVQLKPTTQDTVVFDECWVWVDGGGIANGEQTNKF